VETITVVVAAAAAAVAFCIAVARSRLFFPAGRHCAFIHQDEVLIVEF
jgi:hypothetical protein